MKAALVRLGIRGFNPKLKKAAGRLDGLRTPEGEPIPPNTLAELRRDMARRRLVSDQIRQIEDTRLERLEQAPSQRPPSVALPRLRLMRNLRRSPRQNISLRSLHHCSTTASLDHHGGRFRV
jgi:transposase